MRPKSGVTRLALLDKGGLGDGSALIQFPSLKGGDAELATSLRDNRGQRDQ
jgi:hypothetical protein